MLLEWKKRFKGAIPKTKYLEEVKELMLALNPNLSTNINSGFRATGIIPFHPKPVLSKLVGRQSHVNKTALTESFISVLEKHVEREKSTKISRKRKVNVVAGKSVGPKDFTNTLTSEIEN